MTQATMNHFLSRARGAFARLLAVVAPVALATAMTACGGSGAGAGGAGASGTSQTSSSVADILLVSDKTSLPSSAVGSATITAQLKDAQNNVLANQIVTFGTTDSGSTLTPAVSPVKTDSAGKVSAVLTLANTVAAKTNRTITVSASSGGVTKTIDIAVTGTAMSASGPNTVASGGNGDYTVTLRDSANTGIANVSVTVASGKSNLVTPGTATTDASGQASFRMTGNFSGNDTLTFSALGATASVPVAVSGTVLSVDSPASLEEILVNTTKTVKVTYVESGVPQANKSVLLNVTRGQFTPGGTTFVTLTTDAAGQVSATLTSATAGITTVSAIVVGTSISTSSKAEFVSRVPAKITLSPSPTVIPVNAAGSSSSSSQLVATVRDASDNPVKGATVAFSAPIDPSNGRIEPGLAVTDSTGTATAAFIAGPNSTGQNAVTVRADVVGTGLSSTRNMTVASSSVFVSSGTGNEIEKVDTTTYSDPWAVLVQDANRNPVVGAKVTASLKATAYRKGVWQYITPVGGTGTWVAVKYPDLSSVPYICQSEDVNNNNLLDGGEDVNGNSRLDPGGPAAVQIISTDSLTGADGRVNLRVIYPKSFGQWVFVQLRVTISTAGTESTWEFPPYLLPVLASDVNAATVPPPNVRVVSPEGYLTSPYGYQPDCTNPN